MQAATTPDLGAAVRAERLRRGITQAELARRTGTTRQWISGFERGRDRVETDIALQILDELGLVISVGSAGAGGTVGQWITVADAARQIRAELEVGDVTFALRLLARTVADIREIADPRQRAIAMGSPPSTGDHRWDTLLAATFAREAHERDERPPEWTVLPALDAPWFPDPHPMLAERHIKATPRELSELNIFFDRRNLEAL